MGRYPREARDAQIKCIGCNAPVVTTVEGRYVCVDCGGSPLGSRRVSDDSTPAAPSPLDRGSTADNRS